VINRLNPNIADILLCLIGGLFFYHIASLVISWLLARPLPRTTTDFSLALFLSTLLFLLPSEPFREGFFAFYYHSLFHLYISFCVALLVFLLQLWPLNRKYIGFMLLLTVACCCHGPAAAWRVLFRVRVHLRQLGIP
jgi:hypothetical protein